jgi:hypothetical protein
LTQVLKESIPKERNLGLSAGLEILNACGTVIIGTKYGISEGMKNEIAAAAGKQKIYIRGGRHGTVL